MPTTNPLRTLLALSAIGLGLATGRAQAVEMFHVTKLGGSYSLQQDATGTVHGVQGDDGLAYVFEKSPVTYYPELASYSIGTEMSNGGNRQTWIYAGSGRYGSLPVASNAAGSVGFTAIDYSMVVGGGIYSTAIGIDFSGNYHLPENVVNYRWTTKYGGVPVLDINASGQAVGQYDDGTASWYWNSPGRVAAFSDKGLKSHGPTPGLKSLPDDLNNYIAEDLGIRLAMAERIDDLGQIIAWSTANETRQAYLLTPNGPPTPTPEPASMVVFAAGAVALAAWKRKAGRRA
ncbi:PEP-CTERM sorting domain-containing protein [Tundrisphaera sp. TA3]|uniref:PEP-CTERM sorting domain-containing protein n=1 Tax=Tundrisphaera sp. TA3 TaxID=3435775 RepID=UPI003EB98A6F